VVYGSGGVNVSGQGAGFPSQQRVIINECRMSNTSNIQVQLSPAFNMFYGNGTTLVGLGALMRFYVLEHNV
jgi:hypothetical protein